MTAKDGSRRGEERREEGGGRGVRTARIIDDPFVCFAAKDFESIVACVALPGPAAPAQGEEMSSRIQKMLKESRRPLQVSINVDAFSCQEIEPAKVLFSNR